MKNTPKEKRNGWGWFCCMVLATLILLASRPGQASGLQPRLLGQLAQAQNNAVLKISEDWLIHLVAKQFKSELHSLFTQQNSPFSCLTQVSVFEYVDNSPSQKKFVTKDYTPNLEKDIVQIFIDHLDAVKKEDFTGFDQDVGQLLRQPEYEYPCFQDDFYYGTAYFWVKDTARKVIAQWMSSQVPASDPTSTPAATPPSASSTPPTSGASTPTPPSSPAAPATPAAPVSTAEATEPVKDSQAPAATQTTLTEEPVTQPSPMVSGGACSLSLAQPAQGLSWSYLGYLLMLFPVGVIRSFKAKVFGEPKR